MKRHLKKLLVLVPVVGVIGYLGSRSWYLRHPLVRVSQRMLYTSPEMARYIGKIHNTGLRVSKIILSDKKETGIVYRLKGEKGEARITVIGDYLTHAELLKLNENNTTLFKNCTTTEQRVQEAFSNPQYVPIDLNRFVITSREPSRNASENEPICPDEKIWRLKQLHVLTLDDARTIRQEQLKNPAFEEIINSQYQLQTYGDAKAKCDVLHPYQTNSTQHLKNKYKLLLFMAAGFTFTISFLLYNIMSRVPPMLNPVSSAAIAKALTSSKVKSTIGENPHVLATNGYVFAFQRRAHFSLILYGNQAECLLQVVAKKQGFTGNQWHFSKLACVLPHETITL